MKKQRGFSLAEVIIGIAILLVLATIYLTFVSSASKEIQFSGDHLNSVVIAQKITEDMIEELALNPFGLETLGLDATAGSPQEIVDGKSVFFSMIEDSKAPFGIIDKMSDGAIVPDMQPLYDTVKRFRFSATGERLADSGETEDRNLVQSNILLQWQTKTGKGQFDTAIQLFSPVTKKKVSLGVLMDEAAIDSRIPAEVFYKPGKTIGELATEIGENDKTILALGRISLISRDFATSDSFRNFKNKVKQLKLRVESTPSIDHGKRFLLIRELAKTWYSMGKNCFQVVAYLEPQFKILQTEGKFGSINSGTGFNPLSFQQDLFNFRIIFEYFSGCMEHARFHYNQLLAKDLVNYKGGKTQLQIIQKLMDIYRIVAILPTRPGGMAEYKDFLERIRKFSDGRNPFLYRLATFEKLLLNSPTEWKNRYPNLEGIHQMIAVRVPEILAFIKTQTISAISN